MALFGKKNLADFSLEELEKEIEKRKSAEVVEETPNEEVAEVEETEKVEDPTEVAEETSEQQEEVAENGEIDEEKEDAQDDVVLVLQTKLESALEEIRDYKEKVDALLERVSKIDTPAEEVGLERAKKINADKNEDEMSAHEFAMKNARF